MVFLIESENKVKDLNEGFFSWVSNKLKDVKSFANKKFAKNGQFYLFRYKSKMFEQNEIDYYDQTPLILCFNQDAKYIWGLNINYLPKQNKKRMLNTLEKRYPKQFKKNKSLPNLKYKNIVSELDYIRVDFIIKQYIKDRITKLVKVKTGDIKKVSQIDLSTFVGIRNAKKVWGFYKKGIKPNFLPKK